MEKVLRRAHKGLQHRLWSGVCVVDKKEQGLVSRVDFDE